MAIGIIMMVGILVFFALLLPPLFRSIVKGKIYTYFIEDDGYVLGKLKKPEYNEEYIIDGDGAYDIIPDRVGLTTYPRGLPAFFQSIVPCIMYRRDDPIPTDLTNPMAKAVTAKEIKAALEGHFIRDLVVTTREGDQKTKLQKMLPVLTIAVAAMALVLTFVVLYKMGALENLLKLGA